MARTQHGLPGIYNSSAFTLVSGEGSALSTDASGNLYVTPASGASFGSSTADGSAFVAGTTTGSLAMGVYQTSPTTLSNNQSAAVLIDVNRKLITADIKAEDATHSSGDLGSFDLAVRNDTPTALAGTTLDYIPLTTDANGGLWNSLATLIAGENLTTNRLNVEPVYSYARMTTAATLLVKTGAGTLHSITVNTAVATGTIEFDDALTNTTPIIGKITYPAALLSTGATTSIYDVSFATGLSITTTGTMDITIAYR